ncbi:MAG: hypothetical protein AVO39_00520 [delta proteobacterium MLS_D]|jgi:hypothetical protein|nr:MAG: hypothetical protein AVO39_00520 [delta proteobacterium MLS_D]
MTVIQQKGDKIRQAIKRISSRLEDKDGSKISRLVQEAGQEFNLSPMEQEFLFNFFKEGKTYQEE